MLFRSCAGSHGGWVEGAARAVGDGPLVLYLHDHDSLPLVTGVRADRVAAVSRFLAGADERVAYLPPIVDLDHHRVDTTRRVTLFVNPVPEKGLETALGLARARPDIPFAFARVRSSRPSRRRRLQQAAAELPNVEIREAVDDSRRLYGDARLVLAPSRCSEAWGRVISEAQASGIPAVASRSGGLPEAVGDGGMLVSSDAGLESWVISG